MGMHAERCIGVACCMPDDECMLSDALRCCGQVKDMKEEREGLLQDITKLKTALQHLAARHQGRPPLKLPAKLAATSGHAAVHAESNAVSAPSWALLQCT